jgi:hypothetical protein
LLIASCCTSRSAASSHHLAWLLVPPPQHTAPVTASLPSLCPPPLEHTHARTSLTSPPAGV